MSKSDRIKEELGWLKIVFAVLVAVDVSLVGWLAQNYQTASQLLVVCALVAVSFVTVVVVWVNRAAIRRFKALEDE
jgi:membrane protein YdbS with pleckstrin-like domain